MMDLVMMILCISALYGHIHTETLAWAGLIYTILNIIVDLARLAAREKEAKK